MGLIREVQAVLSRAGKRPEPRKLNSGREDDRPSWQDSLEK